MRPASFGQARWLPHLPLTSGCITLDGAARRLILHLEPAVPVTMTLRLQMLLRKTSIPVDLRQTLPE